MTRQAHLDFLRIISICAVVVIHTAAPYMTVSETGGADWYIATILDYLSRWSVPVFVMISGALFLNPDRPQPLRKLWTKNIPRIAIALFAWNLVYALLYAFPNSASFESLHRFLEAFMLGDVHMWFLYMLLGLYIVTPLLRHIVKSESLTRYFLVLALAVSTLVPFATGFGHLGLVEHAVDQVMLQIPLGYSFYFVLGYQLNRMPVEKIRLGAICIIGAVAAALLVWFAWATAEQITVPRLDYFSLPVLLASIAVFLTARRFIRERTDKPMPALVALSNASFGVYLVHVIVLRVLMDFRIGTWLPNAPTGLVVTAALGIVISFAISLALNKIPIVKKYLV